MIDPHVHLRDWNQKDKETLVHGLGSAKKAGINHVFDMPNTDPPITSREKVLDRLSYAKEIIKENFKTMQYSVYMGITQDKDQIAEAVRTYNELFPLVIGLKLFLGHSTGNMGLITLEEQRKVMYELKDYTGVLVVHAEKEEFCDNSLFDIKNPKTHLVARPRKAEVESIKDIIALIKEVNFKGTLHIAHLTTKEGLDIILKERENGLFISFGITPHHALLCIDDADDYLLKMNPPLKEKEDRDALFNYLLSDGFTFIESDHAPHTAEDKLNGASGIPGFMSNLLLIKKLRENGMSRERELDLTTYNCSKVFNLEYSEESPVANIDKKINSLVNEYPFNAYKSYMDNLDK